MGYIEKLLFQILRGTSDANLQDDRRRRKNQFTESWKQGKPYQVKQVRNVILKYKLGGIFDG